MKCPPPTIQTAAAEIRARRLRPRQLVEACLSRIEQHEGRIQAWVNVDRQAALDAADRLGEELESGSLRGPLHGVPVGIKDIVDVAGWPTRAGSPLRDDHRADRDATIVRLLKAAGAIVLGKTVTTEFACFDPSPTRNPWNEDHTPGGSSSGSAAAVALGMCLAAIGTQTGGSITRPASFCGVCGCKPTFGWVSRAGIVPVSFHLDHPGPLARCVADLAVMLQVIAGVDTEDPFTFDRPVPDYVGGCQSSQPPRLGLLAGFFWERADDSIRAATDEAVATLRASGAEIVQLPLPNHFDDVLSLHGRIMAVEAAGYHRQQYSQHPDGYGPRIGRLIETGLATSAVDYAAALEHQVEFRQQMIQLLGDYDALLTPAAPSTAPATLETTGDPSFNSPWSYTGMPTVSIPCGLAEDHMPAGLQLVGRPSGEARLLAVAAWCEAALGFAELPPMWSVD